MRNIFILKYNFVFSNKNLAFIYFALYFFLAKFLSIFLEVLSVLVSETFRS